MDRPPNVLPSSRKSNCCQREKWHRIDIELQETTARTSGGAAQRRQIAPLPQPVSLGRCHGRLLLPKSRVA